MTSSKSRFSNLAQAIKEKTCGQSGESNSEQYQIGAGIHKPAVVLSAVGESLKDRIVRLESQLIEAGEANAGLAAELNRAKSLEKKAGSAVDEFVFLDTLNIVDNLPKDRLRGAFEGREFDELLSDIEVHGQNDAITVRCTPSGLYEVAAGRRRLEVCRRLGRNVLARVRELDDKSMLCVQFSENERRADISALERARWFAAVRDQLGLPVKDIAGQFGVDPSTFSLYLRLARFPEEILQMLYEPRRLAVLPARRVMEAIESRAGTLEKIIDTLEAFDRDKEDGGVSNDAAAQIEMLMRCVDGKPTGNVSTRSPIPERRHIVHHGRRIGTLTRNGGQWIFRFSTSLPDIEIQGLADRLAVPLTETSGVASNNAKLTQ